jgi:N-carbamoyl-L-amino-acid hydrolase
MPRPTPARLTLLPARLVRVLVELALLGAASATAAELRIDGGRLNDQLRELSAFGRTDAGGVSRIAYGDADLAGRSYVMGLMREAGLAVVVDAAGNIVGRRSGTQPGLKPIVIGSHIDSVPDGGNYDGDVGSLAAIEVARTLAAAGVSLRHPLEVIVFQNEEGGTVGSRAITAGLTEADLALATNSSTTIREGIGRIGGDPDALATARRQPGDIAAYAELHVEQGGTLEAAGIPIGVVEGIVGIQWWDVTVAGFANHAGTTPMAGRRDALLAAARYVDAVNRVATGRPGSQVATVGRMRAFPGANNVIPGRVETSLEIRDLDASTIESLFRQIQDEVRAIEAATGTRFRFTRTSDSAPAPTDERIRRAIEAAADALGLRAKRMPSGAGHDAQELARLGPVGMLFVPSVGGISHSPRELTHPADVTNGANVLLHTLLALDAW